MNKDVVYIEPEEDITDIIAKIKGSKSKIVALVPPKKASVFRSIVNIKLIMKAGGSAEKTVVLVTTDPSIIKLAAATKIPVTKDLKSAPAVPELDDVLDTTEVVDVDDEAEETKESDDKDTEESDKDSVSEDDKNEEEEEEEEDEDDKKEESDKSENDTDKNDKDEKNSEEIKNEDAKDTSKRNDSVKKKESKLARSNNPVLKWIGTHKKLTVGIGICVVVLIILAIWAFVIVPAVTIKIKLETTTGNFSENVSFTDKLTDEKVTEGKFYIEEKKLENKAEVEFEATGKKNVGEKASGNVVVYAYLKDSGSVSIKAGTIFTYDSKLKFASTEDATLAWDGKDSSKCDNKDNATSLIKSGCQISARIKVQATEPGAGYNVAAANSGWTTSAQVGVYSDAAMAGGSDKEVTIVQQSDIDAALKNISSENEATNKQKLLDTLSDDQFAIASSFKQTTSDPVSTPKVGEEVEEGKKAKLSVTTTDTIYVVDETKLIEFISEKAKLDKGYKIYEMNDPFIENFTQTDSGFVGKLKTSYVAGSTITEGGVVDTVKGKGIGTAKRDLSDNFDGIKSISIDTSMPWVTSVPGNTEKITVIISTEE